MSAGFSLVLVIAAVVFLVVAAGSGLLRLSFGNSGNCDALVRGGAHCMTRPTSYAPIADALGRGLQLGCLRRWPDRHRNRSGPLDPRYSP